MPFILLYSKVNILKFNDLLKNISCKSKNEYISRLKEMFISFDKFWMVLVLCGCYDVYELF